MDDEHHLEETFRHKEKKEIRHERQRASSRDRSKYKKTDQKKQTQRQEREREKIADGEGQLGRVTKIRSEGIFVAADDKTYLCKLRGVLKKEKREKKSLVAVGDIVRFIPQPDQEGAIIWVEPRASILSRADNLRQRQEQIIATNIDMVIITLSVVVPLLKPPLIDRYLIATTKGNMEPLIVINKIDLLDQASEQKELFDAVVRDYKAIGYTVIPISAITKEGIDTLQKAIAGKAIVFAGQSGAGKSSLINALTGTELPTGETIDKTKKGAHTTTAAELLPLPQGGWCVDTPGIKSFGMWDLDKQEIADHYPEFEPLKQNCHFPNCTHTHEPDCAVLEALEKGEISSLRYDNYRSLYEQVGTEHKPR